MKKTFLKFLFLFTALTPAFAYAQQAGFQTLTGIVNQIGTIVKLLIPIVFGLAVLGFFWGVVKYIFAQGSEDSKADGKKIMLWALVALFVMVSAFGIIRLAQRTLGVGENDTIRVPTIENFR